MISAKRLSLQLTPLLDLLLIVIFAQYLEIEQTSTAENHEYVAEQARQQYELQKTQEELAFTKSVLATSQQFRTQTEQELTQLQQQQQTDRQTATAEQQELSLRLKDVSQQRDRIIGALKDVYAQSSEEIKKLIEKMLPPVSTPQLVSPDQINTLANQIADSPPRDLATFLLAYEELRKRSDIWEVHFDQQGTLSIFDGQTRHELVIPKEAANKKERIYEFVFQFYRALPQTRGLVILLASYDEIRADWREDYLLALRDVTDRLRTDSAGRTRFEYAVIGYLPETKSSAQPPRQPENQP